MSDLVHYERNGQDYVTTPEGFVDELTYLNYKHNRHRAQSISAEQWEKVYGPETPHYEARFQAELKPLLDQDKCEFCA